MTWSSRIPIEPPNSGPSALLIMSWKFFPKSQRNRDRNVSQSVITVRAAASDSTIGRNGTYAQYGCQQNAKSKQIHCQWLINTRITNNEALIIFLLNNSTARASVLLTWANLPILIKTATLHIDSATGQNTPGIVRNERLTDPDSWHQNQKGN